ncbi:MAG: Repeat-containing protein [Candidatus Wolfebacteria bacterium GW2011_GWE1_48_7]|uniref:Repeat-containing protein n=2 Tax=Candidatus Wolfeibacteriota TaxID=1752735 RepID=A0A0G1X5L1_9BACT|nr:MAG: fibronectin type III domain-containing protein [Candidatus Wolfebacteria bacterium GW2011_GWB1_47_1]KKU34424.1 MAG: Repeat-containing protein [Candidatus Wolfebacteria bacterium GW2011_GWC2_46_275]KKU41896.1 MAG: Repeat-containing protein [Candidatus Wolfebacteria bacterium GW2011_GWB2_46_69]KKU54175.1 MAG: Repeat-containing protein [Candidatus Wolfebacteria bacterium GW2011_GWC1_47_103]KKU59097.1 MAG: Repeat-containing protein [Candidatus Wolfebacteria bacterium GW2011_GWE2_47_12]KKU6
MRKQILKSILFLGTFLMLPNSSQAAIIFEDNFDDTPNWQSQQLTFGGGGIAWGTPTFQGTCIGYCPPQNWTSYRTSQSLWTPNARDTYLIDSSGSRTVNGKGLTYNVESSGEWGTWAGGGIDKYLGVTGYPELYVRFWLKESAEFCWGSEALNLNAMGKLIRISALRRDPTSNPNIFNPQLYPSSDVSPTLIGNAYRRFQPNYGVPAQFDMEERYAPNYEYGPQCTFGPQPSSCASEAPSAITFPHDNSGYCGDDQWHSYEYYVKLNSALDATDGIYKAWLDGTLVAQKSNIPWVKSGTDTNGTAMTLDTGWNWVMIADNIDSTAYAKSDNVEMSRYIDDVVMYTPMNGSEMACGGACIAGRLPLTYLQSGLDSTPPSAPTGLSIE